MKNSTYSIGYSKKIVSLLAKRTAMLSAAYLLPYLKKEMHLLDCGCGPGTISIDFATVLNKGFVTATDIESSQIEEAKNLANRRSVKNISFQKADICALPFEDNSFDVTHVHAVLCQIKDPISAIYELKRVTKEGGIIACREPDFDAYLVYSENPLIEKAITLAKKAVSCIGGDYYIGKKLRSMFSDAGCKKTIASASCEAQGSETVLRSRIECFINDLEEAPWGKLIVEENLASRAEIEEFKVAFSELLQDSKKAFFSLMWCEIIAFV